MVARRAAIPVTADLDLIRVLDAANDQPVALDRDGTTYLVIRSSGVPSAGNDLPPQESVLDQLKRASAEVMRGRRFDDSTELLREARDERGFSTRADLSNARERVPRT